MAKESRALDHRELAVEELSMAEARQLALALLGRDDAVALAQAHVVATESGGNPLFIDELVRHIQSGEPIDRWEAIGQLDLDEVLWTRIKRQPQDALRLLGLVAVSGRPIRQSLAFQASELGVGARVALASLRSARLIRCLGQAHSEEIEIYHDRIRETVVAHLPGESVRWNHERLALVLLTSGSVDPEILAVHYRGAGQAARACEYYSLAADQAAAALAFDHSARLYRFALELHEGTPAQAGALWRKLGDALANAGRGNEAAQVYAKAAERATAAETLELKRLESTQLLLSGHVEDGLALLRTLLGPLGLSMPRTAREARRSLLWHRFLLKLHGLKFQSAMKARSRRWRWQDRSLLVGRGGALDVGADPRGRLPDPRALAGSSGRRAAEDRPGHGHGSWTPGHRGGPGRGEGREPARRGREDRSGDRLTLCPRHD